MRWNMDTVYYTYMASYIILFTYTPQLVDLKRYFYFGLYDAYKTPLHLYLNQ